MFMTDCWQVAGFAAEVTDRMLTRMLAGIQVQIGRASCRERV